MKPSRFHLTLSALHLVAALGFARAAVIVPENLAPWIAGALVLSLAHALRARSLRSC